MSEATLPPYAFKRGRRAILAEVLFPKKVQYQPEIYRALEQGLKENVVKDYLIDHAEYLLQEMGKYPQLFDPLQYERTRMSKSSPITLEQAYIRLNNFKSHFHGWSMYEVDGMFEGDVEGKLYEERTQIIRLIFRLDSAYEETAKEEKCYDV